jgi:predicted Zn-dependent peptidase
LERTTSRSSRCFPLLALLALAPLGARAADPELKFEKYQLPNGLTVILSEDHRLPQVVVNAWYHVGAANQAAGKSGFAHLFEHMMFSGSKHVQPSPFAPLEQIGATGINGSTNFDRTNYFETVPSAELATALWVESDRMAFLLDTLDEKKLKIQRDVVSNERRQRYENVAGAMTFLRTCDLLFPTPHPFYQCVIGSVPEIQAATPDDLKAFFRAYYGPQNTSLSLVGDFDPAVARALIEKYFGPIPRGPEIARPSLPQPALAGVVKETVEDKVAELATVQLTFTAVKSFSDDEPAGHVLATILGGGRTSRLYKALVFDKQAASETAANLTATSLGGWFSVDAQVKAGHPVAELLPLLQAELDAIKKDGPTAAEVERAQRRFVAGRVRAVERLGTRADLLNSYETYLGDPGFLPRDLARYRAVTPEAVRAFAVKYLTDDKRLELTTVPAPKQAAKQDAAQPAKSAAGKQ